MKFDPFWLLPLAAVAYFYMESTHPTTRSSGGSRSPKRTRFDVVKDSLQNMHTDFLDARDDGDYPQARQRANDFKELAKEEAEVISTVPAFESWVQDNITMAHPSALRRVKAVYSSSKAKR